MKGYQMNKSSEMSSAMEYYLEMIMRLGREGNEVRVGDLSRMLHVKPSSVTKMIQQLDRNGYLISRKYGEISLTEKGRQAGNYLLYRHDVLHRFLCALNHTDNELEEVEKLEHFVGYNTVENLDRLTKRLSEMGIFPMCIPRISERKES